MIFNIVVYTGKDYKDSLDKLYSRGSEFILRYVYDKIYLSISLLYLVHDRIVMRTLITKKIGSNDNARWYQPTVPMSAYHA